MQSEPLRRERAKPRRPAIAVTYRAYRAAAALLPPRWLARRLLNASWLVNRIAMEQVVTWLGPEQATSEIRPHTLPFIQAQLTGDERVLDLGGGSAAPTKTMAKHAAEVVYVDMDPQRVIAARRSLNGVRCECGDGIELAEREGPFDIVFMLHVLEHLDDPVGKLRRLVASCRHLAVEVPDVSAPPLNDLRRREGLPFYADDDHVTEFTPQSLTSVVERAGWRVVSLDAVSGVLYVRAETR
jgi:SAM-dependent methyltransferase